MVFGGLQKLTLLDFPGKVACILFTKGCNFRCPFCHNASLVTHLDDNSVSEEEVLRFLEKRRSMLEGVVITGGEPLLHKGIGDFIKKIKALGYAVKLDTNGSFPDTLISLAKEGVIDYVAMDIKHQKEKYSSAAGGDNLSLSDIERSIDFLIKGTVPYEFRTTVCDPLHTVEDIKEIAKWIKGAEKYFLQNFVDSGDIIENGFKPITDEILCEMKTAAEIFVPNVEIRGK